MLSSGKSSAPTALHVLVNGKDSDSIALPSSDRASALLRTDLTTLTKPGDNLIELKIDDGTSLISAQVVSTYYTPWPNEKNTDTTKLSTGELRLNVSYSKTEAKEDDTIECHVKAERVGFRGYGMMLAEIGLPPGVDVNRESLDAAVANNWTIDHYDVLPDHVVLYLWPTAGGADLTFKFRLRFAMQAETAPSMIYDYYNPDAVVIVSPKKFSVEEKAAMVAARRNF
jgi:hypothetical protein